ncbi:MAG: hypothetical protein RL499_1091 [Actinomycetota bacterium]
MIRFTTRARLSCVVGAVVVAVMSGCSPPAPEASSSASPSPSPSEASASASPSASPSPSAVDDTAARESLADSISSGNTAALASWVTDPVMVTIAATEFSEPRTPDEAAGDVNYVVDLSATWNFALPEATIDTYRAGSYASHFPPGVLVGLSSTGSVIAFTMTAGEASAIFMSADEMLLL